MQAREIRSNKSIRCLHYPVDAIRPIAFNAEMQSGIEAEIINPEFLDLSHIFPNGCYSFKYTHIPGTTFPLQRDLRIFITNKSSYMRNRTVHTVFGQLWHGDIVVAKYKRNHNMPSKEGAQILPHEADMINVLIGM